MTEKIANPKVTQEILHHYGLKLKKSLGQNFLLEPNILQKIVETGQVNCATNVLEIGPGIGALTQFLAESAHQVVAIEIDSRLLEILSKTLADYPNVTVINADILQADLAQIVQANFEANLPVKVVANLPYYITTPILLHLLASPVNFDQIVVMMQKEVAERLRAVPSTKAYGSLSVFVQYYTEVKIEFIVPKTVFFPQPKVDSAIISLTKRSQPPVEVTNEEQFFKLVRASFKMRRKTLWNNLIACYGKTDSIKSKLNLALEQANIDPRRRGETLSIVEFARLSNNLCQ